MKTYIRAALLALAFSLSTHSIADARNGYRLVFIDMSLNKSSETINQLRNYFTSKFPSEMYDCSEVDRFIEFDLTYMKKRPKAITQELVANSLRLDKSSLKELRKALRNYRDSEIDKGFDGLVIFRNEGEFYELITIGSFDNDYMASYKASNRHNMDTKTIKALFCGSLARLPFAYID